MGLFYLVVGNNIINNSIIVVPGINVPRSRFLPVKKTSDLMLVMSNLYSMKNGSLVMSPQRMFPTTPFIKLGDNHFAKVCSIH
jgi:UTP--glucose-1-phosphate uridylyltransferase.